MIKANIFAKLFRNKVFLVIIASFSVRVILAVIFGTFQHPVTWEYEEIAINLMNGKGYLYHHLGGTPYLSFNNPLYGYICAGIYSITKHNFAVVLLMQFLFSMATIYLIFLLGKTLFNNRLGILAAMLVAFHPGLIYYDVFNLLPFSIDTFIITFIAFAIIKFKREFGYKNVIFIGFLIGLGLLSRGVIGAILPFFCIYMLCFIKIALSKKLMLISALFSAALIVIMPWAIRNFVIHKKYVFISTTGEVFWMGNNILATGTPLSQQGLPILKSFPVHFQKQIYSLDEMGQKKFFENEAFRFIRHNPFKFIQLYAKKFFYFWWFSPQSGALYPRSHLIIYKLFYSFLLTFSIFAFFHMTVFKKCVNLEDVSLIILILLAISSTQSLFYSEGRHRWLIEPMLLLFFVYGIFSFYDIVKRLILKKGG